MKITKIETVTVIISLIAAILCGAGSTFSAPVFVLSSSIGLSQSIKNKLLSPICINLISLGLNLFSTIKMCL